MVSEFDASKARILTGLDSGAPDASPQGHVDPLCVPIINRINGHADLVTTSSCSGRISIFHTGEDECKRKARGGGWLLVSHVPVTTEQVTESLGCLPQGPGLVSFKFEPFILHVQCRNFPAAQAFLTAAVGAGYRNSGLMAGSRFMVAVRSTLHLEVPVAKDGQLLVDTAYLTLLTNLANQKFAENAARIEAFCGALTKQWTCLADLPRQKAVRRAEKREQRRKDRNHHVPDSLEAEPVSDEGSGYEEVACALFGREDSGE